MLGRLGPAGRRRGACAFVAAILAPVAATALESDMLNLRAPSVLEAREKVLDVQHRFWGRVDEEPLGSFLGMDGGANVGIGLTYCLGRGVEVRASRTRLQKEYAFGAGYAFSVVGELLRGQGEVEFFRYDKPPLRESRRNLWYLLALQGRVPTRRVTALANVCYDGYNERFGYGIGVRAGTETQWGPLRRVDVVAEYFPVAGREKGITGPKDSFAVGAQGETYGHQFALLVGNSSQIGARRLMLGAAANDLYFGFNIRRLL